MAPATDTAATDTRRSAWKPRTREQTNGPTRKTLTLVLEEIMRLVDASKEGRLSERGKATLFNGMHREMIQGVNEMLDAILLPIGEGNRILAQISGGKIDELIAQTYKGDHEKMKVAVNNVGHRGRRDLQKELARLIEASQEGSSPSAASRSSSRALSPRLCAASTPCWTRFCCPSAKATAFWRRFPTAKSTS